MIQNRVVPAQNNNNMQQYNNNNVGTIPPQATMVYGIPLPPTASTAEIRLVRTVMRLSAIMALVAIIQQVTLMATGQFQAQNTLSIIVSLMVPACGWYGAKERNKFFLQIFSCMNWCNALVFGLEFINVLMFFDFEYHECLKCQEAKARAVKDAQNYTNNCKIDWQNSEDKELDPTNCDQYRSGAGVVLILIIWFALIIFYSYNGILSSRLSNMDVFVSSRVHAGPHGQVATQQQMIQMVPQNYAGAGAYSNGRNLNPPQLGNVIIVQEPPSQQQQQQQRMQQMGVIQQPRVK